MKQFILFTCLLVLTACSEDSREIVVNTDDTVSLNGNGNIQTANRSVNTYFFGFDLRSTPQEDAKQYLPFLEYLQDATGYNFELKFTAKGHNIIDDLDSDLIHFAAIGAGSYIKADEKKRPISLVRGKNSSGKAEYRSIIVVAKDSRLTSLHQLKNKVFAFGNNNSTQGHVIPRIILSKAGIKLNDFTQYLYTGSHHNCVNSVISGKADACGMQDTMAKSMAEQNLVKILFQSEYYPSSGIVASQHVSSKVRNLVKQALLSFEPEGKHQVILYNWHKTEMPKGFVPSSDADYKSLRDWAGKLGLLGNEE